MIAMLTGTILPAETQIRVSTIFHLSVRIRDIFPIIFLLTQKNLGRFND